MNIARTLGLVLGLFAGAALARAAAPPPAPASPKPKVVLRISRAFLVQLARKQFTQDEPISTSAMGATVEGSAHVAGSYDVKLHKSASESDFDLLVRGDVATQMVVTRRPVCIVLRGTAPFQASRRVAFDGKTFTGQPVGAGACYHSELEQICSLRGGPAAPLVRRVARPIVLRSLPESDQTASEEVRSQVSKSVAQETDKIVAVLNEIAALHGEAAVWLRECGVPLDRHRVALAATDDDLLAGVGFAPGQPPQLPPGAGPTQAPVEIWVHHKLTATQEALVQLLPEEDILIPISASCPSASGPASSAFFSGSAPC